MRDRSSVSIEADVEGPAPGNESCSIALGVRAHKVGRYGESQRASQGLSDQCPLVAHHEKGEGLTVLRPLDSGLRGDRPGLFPFSLRSE